METTQFCSLLSSRCACLKAKVMERDPTINICYTGVERVLFSACSTSLISHPYHTLLGYSLASSADNALPAPHVVRSGPQKGIVRDRRDGHGRKNRRLLDAGGAQRTDIERLTRK